MFVDHCGARRCAAVYVEAVGEYRRKRFSAQRSLSPRARRARADRGARVPDAFCYDSVAPL
jgi:hypothetical protein